MTNEMMSAIEKVARRALQAGLLVACLVLAYGARPAQARLGEDFQSYKARTASAYQANGEKKDGSTTNYMFTVKLPPQSAQASPGYAVGVTISTTDGKITGQSMSIRPGMNPIPGGFMASLHAFAFAYEAIGKPVPQDKVKAEASFKMFSGAVTAAFLGTAQNVRFKGFPGVITLRKDASGSLLVAVK